MKKKKVLILGVTGQDGSFMAKLLLDKKYLVYGFIRKSATGNTKNISDLIKNKNFIKCHGDLLDINQYLEFLKPEKRVAKARIKQGNIYRLVRYGGDTQRGISARYVFVIGKVVDAGNVKLHCIKINEVLPTSLISMLRKLRDKSTPITPDYEDLASLLKKFDKEGKRLFEGFIKNNRAVYSYKLGNYRTYFMEKIQHVSEIVFEYDELMKKTLEKQKLKTY